MAANPSNGSDLAASLAWAIDNYRATWQPVDSELYALCHRRPSQRVFADVFAKVAIIGRVYAAGISRTVRVDGNPEAAVAARAGPAKAGRRNDPVGQFHVKCGQESVQVGDHGGLQGPDVCRHADSGHSSLTSHGTLAARRRASSPPAPELPVNDPARLRL